MKKVFTILVTATIISVVLATSLGVPAFADGNEIVAPYGYQDAAPESGDGISNRSGFDRIVGSPDSKGPAPNSGDGIRDGSGI